MICTGHCRVSTIFHWCSPWMDQWRRPGRRSGSNMHWWHIVCAFSSHVTSWRLLVLHLVRTVRSRSFEGYCKVWGTESCVCPDPSLLDRCRQSRGIAKCRFKPGAEKGWNNIYPIWPTAVKGTIVIILLRGWARQRSSLGLFPEKEAAGTEEVTVMQGEGNAIAKHSGLG